MANTFGPGGFEPGSFDEFLARAFGAGDGASGSSGGSPHRPTPPMRRIDITELMTEPTQRLLGEAARFATTRGQGEVDILHLLRVVAAESPTRELLQKTGANVDEIEREIDNRLPPSRETDRETPPVLTTAAKRVLLQAHQVAQALGSTYIAPEHLLLTMAADQDTEVGRMLAAADVTPQTLQEAATGERTKRGGKNNRSSTPTLDEYGVDLTASARDGRLDPVIGREDEIEQTIEVLSRRTKNNPVLIGEAGVGKTAIVEGIAQRIADHVVPSSLLDKRVVQLELSGMLAGTRYRGDFEERMTKVIDEVTQAAGEIIVFIDELHTVVGAGGAEGSVDAGNMLKPRLARGELHVVGATTLDEYRKNIEKDAALERRFQPVLVPEPSVDDTVTILGRLREQYAEHHRVHYTDEALEAAARLSNRYVTDRYLPDKAIDVVDQAGARKRLREHSNDPEIRNLRQRVERLEQDKDAAVAEERYEQASKVRDEILQVQSQLAERGAPAEAPAATDTDERLEVTLGDIAEVVSRRTGVPVAQLTESEKERLRTLETALHERVVGQEDAVAAIARSVRRSRSGMGDANRPDGSFLFLGPTGVGKTELAKALAQSLFGDEDRMVRLDMSEFGERHTVSRLFGAPPGYVGYGEAGELTEAVRRRPYSVVLLDEIEKAHPDIFNSLLQVLEDGRMTDGQGRTVDFRNTVLIMTSNLGSEVISSRAPTLGFTTAGREREEQNNLRERLMPKLKEAFRPEFLNRVDEVVVFERLSDEQLHTITSQLLRHTQDRLASQGVEAEFSPAAIAWLAERGHQPEFGARPLRRTIQREVDDRIADLLLDGSLAKGGRVLVDAQDDGELTFRADSSAVVHSTAA